MKIFIFKGLLLACSSKISLKQPLTIFLRNCLSSTIVDECDPHPFTKICKFHGQKKGNRKLGRTTMIVTRGIHHRIPAETIYLESLGTPKNSQVASQY